MDTRACVWVGESFSSHDKWQIELLSEFFPNSHSTFYEWLTQKIITCRVWKFMNGHEGMCMSRGSFLKHDKWEIKLLSEFLYNSHSHFMSDSNSKNNNLQGFENSQMVSRGCVWVGESFSSHDKWQIKLLSEFLYKSHSTIYEWFKLKK